MRLPLPLPPLKLFTPTLRLSLFWDARIVPSKLMSSESSEYTGSPFPVFGSTYDGSAEMYCWRRRSDMCRPDRRRSDRVRFGIDHDLFGSNPPPPIASAILSDARSSSVPPLPSPPLLALPPLLLLLPRLSCVDTLTDLSRGADAGAGAACARAVVPGADHRSARGRTSADVVAA